MGAALLSVTFSYGGWQNASAVAGEIRRPQRTLPIGILAGTTGVIALYLSLNGALCAILGPAAMAATRTPVADAAGRVLPGGEIVVAVLVLISTFAIIQVLLMVLPRIFFAMARDGVFFRSVTRVHPRWSTPWVAIAALGGASLVHVFLGRHLDLLQAVILCDWFGFTLCALALFVLRRTRPDAPRPYRATGYPVLPGIFLLCAAGILVYGFLSAEKDAVIRAIAIGIVGVVLFLFFFFLPRARRTQSGDSIS